MASVLQTVFSLPAFQQRYNTIDLNHSLSCDEPLPADCVECQMHKVADGLLSGRYAHPANYVGSADHTPQSENSSPVFQEGIKPTGFKALIGKGHEEFSTMRQQDSEEFLTYLLTVLRRDAHKHKGRAEPGTCNFIFVVLYRYSVLRSSCRCYVNLLVWHGAAIAMRRLQKGEISRGQYGRRQRRRSRSREGKERRWEDSV